MKFSVENNLDFVETTTKKFHSNTATLLHSFRDLGRETSEVLLNIGTYNQSVYRFENEFVAVEFVANIGGECLSFEEGGEIIHLVFSTHLPATYFLPRCAAQVKLTHKG